MDEFGHENGALVTVFIPTDTHERGNTGQLYVCFVLLWKLNQELRKRLLSFYWVFKKKNVQGRYKSGADPGFQVRGGALKKIAPSGGRRENFWGISCEKSRFYAGCAPPPLDPPLQIPF
jgi:hypothetical protein